jgi:hypothetical protein
LRFVGDWLFGDWFGWHGKKDICPIEAEATRKKKAAEITLRPFERCVAMPFISGIPSLRQRRIY